MRSLTREPARVTIREVSGGHRSTPRPLPPAHPGASHDMSTSCSSGPPTRPSVLAGVRDGDQRAWTTFFEIYAPLVYRYARHASLSDQDAEDVVANVMRNFVRALPGFTYDRSVGKFRHYLKKVANHEIAAIRRRRSTATDLNSVPERAGEDEPLDQYWHAVEREERLRMCQQRLRSSGQVRPRDWLAFERYALQGEPAEQVAKELCMSKSRLYVIKHEVIEKLRQCSRELDGILGEV